MNDNNPEFLAMIVFSLIFLFGLSVVLLGLFLLVATFDPVNVIEYVMGNL